MDDGTIQDISEDLELSKSWSAGKSVENIDINIILETDQLEGELIPKETIMLTTETGLGSEMLKRVLEICSSLRKFRKVVARILRWIKNKFMINVKKILVDKMI